MRQRLRPTPEERARAVALAAELRDRLRREGRLRGRYSKESVTRLVELGKAWWRLRQEAGEIKMITGKNGRIEKIIIKTPRAKERSSLLS